MKIFSVNIIFDEVETLRLKEQWKDRLTPKKAKKLRVYEVTTEADRFKKWRCSFGIWSTIKLHLSAVLKYWFDIRPKYLQRLSNQSKIRLET